MKRFAVMLTLVVTLLAMGCTRLRVTKVEYAADGTEVNPGPGIRYSLPKPVLKVVPNSDGTVDVEVVYLPDRNRTFAIDAGSKAAKHKLEIGIERGLLQKITWEPDATAVAKQAVESAAAVEKALIEQRRKAEEDAENEALEARKKLEQAAADARAALETEELELALKQAELAFLLDLPPSAETDGKIVAARLAIALAEVKVDRAREEVVAADARLVDDAERLAFTIAANAPSAGSDTAPGPVFYAINESVGSPPEVKLIAAEIETGKKQKSFKTATLRKPKISAQPELAPRGGTRPRLPLAATVEHRNAAKAVRYAEVRLETLKDNGGTATDLRKAEVSLALAREQMAVQREEAYEFEVDSSVPLYQLGSSYDDLVSDCVVIEPANAAQRLRCRLKSSAVVVVELPADYPHGSYLLKINFVYRSGNQERDGAATVGFDVEHPAP